MSKPLGRYRLAEAAEAARMVVVVDGCGVLCGEVASRMWEWSEEVVEERGGAEIQKWWAEEAQGVGGGIRWGREGKDLTVMFREGEGASWLVGELSRVGVVTVCVGMGGEEDGAGEAGGEGVEFRVEAVRKPPMVVVVKGAPVGVRPQGVAEVYQRSGCRVLAEPNLQVEKMVLRVRGRKGEEMVKEVVCESRDWEVSVEGDGGEVGVPTHVFFPGTNPLGREVCVACEVVVPAGVEVPRLQACVKCGGFGHGAEACVPLPALPRSFAEMVKRGRSGSAGVGGKPGVSRVVPLVKGVEDGSKRCWECGKSGHSRRVCPEVVCFKCRGKGHLSYGCTASARCMKCGQEGHLAFKCTGTKVVESQPEEGTKVQGTVVVEDEKGESEERKVVEKSEGVAEGGKAASSEEEVGEDGGVVGERGVSVRVEDSEGEWRTVGGERCRPRKRLRRSEGGSASSVI